jgi:hypothetical protein
MFVCVRCVSIRTLDLRLGHRPHENEVLAATVAQLVKHSTYDHTIKVSNPDTTDIGKHK